MRKKQKFIFEVGDANYVKPGEYFVQLSADGKEITSIKKRQNDLSLVDITAVPLAVENNKTVTASSATVVVNPSTGKDVMKKATVTVPLEDGTATYSIAELTAGEVELEPSGSNIGFSKVTITFTA